MAKEEHLAILEQGVTFWNEWRNKNPTIRPELSGADLRNADLHNADLSNADLSNANLILADLSEANLSLANLKGAVLYWANLREANLYSACLSGADLGRANLGHANLILADLSEANLSLANLREANLIRADLSEANLAGAQLGFTIFVDVDLSKVKELETARHDSPSFIGVDTLYRSKGNISEVFLRGCGVPETMISYVASLAGEPIQFYSAFISYSTKDQEFAKQLHADLQHKGLRVWFAPKDVKGGKKLYEQIDQAIRLYDKLLLVLSENSLQSEWVMTEIRKARKQEIREKRRKLFPIRLVDFERLRAWECFDADTGKDLAVEVREYFIPDFSKWKDPDCYKLAFDRLLRDLQAGGEKPKP